MSESRTRAATESANRRLKNPFNIEMVAMRQNLITGANEFTNDASGKNPRPETIILMSCERTEFTVPLALAEQSGLVKSKVDRWPQVKRIPLLIVKTTVLEHIISFWTEHLGSDKFTKEREEEVQNWEKRFFEQMNHEQLLDLEEAACYMDAKELLDRTREYIFQLPIDHIESTFRIV